MLLAAYFGQPGYTCVEQGEEKVAEDGGYASDEDDDYWTLHAELTYGEFVELLARCAERFHLKRMQAQKRHVEGEQVRHAPSDARMQARMSVRVHTSVG